MDFTSSLKCYFAGLRSMCAHAYDEVEYPINVLLPKYNFKIYFRNGDSGDRLFFIHHKMKKIL